MNKFQKQLFSNLPLEWGVELVPDVCFFQEGPGLLRKQFGDSKNGIPFINIRCIKQDGTIDRGAAQFVKKTEVESKYEHFLLEEGDYVLSTSGTLGRLAKVNKKDIPMLLNTSVIRFRATDSEKLNDAFLRHLLKSSLFYDQIAVESQGSAQVNVGPTHIQKCYFSLPLLEEQKKIAEILSSVDEVIELTEKEISKLQDLKKGMMQELLTKGIGHTKFKDSPVGRIPESWNVKSVQNIAKVVDSLHKTPKFAESGYYMIRVTDIVEGNLKFDNSLKVSEEVYQDFSKNHKPVRGDIVMTRVGSFGRSSYVDTDIDFCIGQNTVVINPEENSKYLYYFLNSEVVWNQVLNETNGSSQGSLSLKAIKELKISIPKKEELDKIVSSLDSISKHIEHRVDKLDKIQNVKKGLMQDLLTGKVRVKV